MTFEWSFSSVSWIRFEAIEAVFRMPFQHGLAHHDDPEGCLDRHHPCSKSGGQH